MIVSLFAGWEFDIILVWLWDGKQIASISKDGYSVSWYPFPPMSLNKLHLPWFTGPWHHCHMFIADQSQTVPETLLSQATSTCSQMLCMYKPVLCGVLNIDLSVRTERFVCLVLSLFDPSSLLDSLLYFGFLNCFVSLVFDLCMFSHSAWRLPMYLMVPLMVLTMPGLLTTHLDFPFVNKTLLFYL